MYKYSNRLIPRHDQDFIYPPGREASKVLTNLPERKNPNTYQVYGVKKYVCLSVCYKLVPLLSLDWQNTIV